MSVCLFGSCWWNKSSAYKWCPMCGVYIHIKPEEALKGVLDTQKQSQEQLPTRVSRAGCGTGTCLLAAACRLELPVHHEVSCMAGSHSLSHQLQYRKASPSLKAHEVRKRLQICSKDRFRPKKIPLNGKTQF